MSGRSAQLSSSQTMNSAAFECIWEILLRSPALPLERRDISEKVESLRRGQIIWGSSAIATVPLLTSSSNKLVKQSKQPDSLAQINNIFNQHAVMDRSKSQSGTFPKNYYYRFRKYVIINRFYVNFICISLLKDIRSIKESLSTYSLYIEQIFGYTKIISNDYHSLFTNTLRNVIIVKWMSSPIVTFSMIKLVSLSTHLIRFTKTFFSFPCINVLLLLLLISIGGNGGNLLQKITVLHNTIHIGVMKSYQNRHTYIPNQSKRRYSHCCCIAHCLWIFMSKRILAQNW